MWNPRFVRVAGETGEGITGLGVDREKAQITSQVTRLNEAFHVRAAPRLYTAPRTRRYRDLFNPLALKPVPRSRKKILPALTKDHMPFTLRRLFTFLTPLVDPAIWPAFSFCSSVFTAPVRVTVPSKVLTEMAKPLKMDSSKSFALTFVVMVASSTTCPADLPAGVWQEENTNKTAKHKNSIEN
jgi:hypothetical protein